MRITTALAKTFRKGSPSMSATINTRAVLRRMAEQLNREGGATYLTCCRRHVPDELPEALWIVSFLWAEKGDTTPAKAVRRVGWLMREYLLAKPDAGNFSCHVGVGLWYDADAKQYESTIVAGYKSEATAMRAARNHEQRFVYSTRYGVVPVEARKEAA